MIRTLNIKLVAYPAVTRTLFMMINKSILPTLIQPTALWWPPVTITHRIRAVKRLLSLPW